MGRVPSQGVICFIVEEEKTFFISFHILCREKCQICETNLICIKFELCLFFSCCQLHWIQIFPFQPPFSTPNWTLTTFFCIGQNRTMQSFLKWLIQCHFWFHTPSPYPTHTATPLKIFWSWDLNWIWNAFHASLTFWKGNQDNTSAPKGKILQKIREH